MFSGNCGLKLTLSYSINPFIKMKLKITYIIQLTPFTTAWDRIKSSFEQRYIYYKQKTFTLIKPIRKIIKRILKNIFIFFINYVV